MFYFRFSMIILCLKKLGSCLLTESILVTRCAIGVCNFQFGLIYFASIWYWSYFLTNQYFLVYTYHNLVACQYKVWAKINHKITSNHLLSPKLLQMAILIMLRCHFYVLYLLKQNICNCHHNSTQILKNTAGKFGIQFNPILLVWSKQYWYELVGNGDSPISMVPTYLKWGNSRAFQG